MLRQIAEYGNISDRFLIIVLIFLGIGALLCLLRLILGPFITDRLLAGNMLGGIVNVMICVLYVLLKEDFLIDVALVYAMASFLAFIVISNIYLGVFRKRKVDSAAAAGAAAHEASDTTVKEDAADGQ